MNSLSKLRKSGIALMVGALALSGAVGVSVVANAAETGPATPTVPVQHIDTNQTGTIVIHKFANPATGTDPGNGLAAKPTTKPVAGVTFTYQKVTEIDLTKNEGWKKASDLQVDADGKVTTKAGVAVGVGDATAFTATDKQGKALVDGLDLGVYLIKETDTPHSVVSKAKPFLVTVPFPNNDAATKAKTPWLYTVNVYPKNTVLTDDERPKKVVNDEADIHFPGDEISWTITQKIPALANGEQLKKYEFTDTLPDTVKAITDADTKILVAVTGADKNVITVNPNKSVDGQKVKVEFTGDDLKKLTAGATVTITLKTTIADAPAGPIVNQSVTNFNDHGFHSIPDGVTITPDNDPDAPGNDPKDMATKIPFADLKIHKQNSSAQPLQGAKFKVAPANTKNTCEGVMPKTAQSAFGKKELITDAAGDISLPVKVGTYCFQEVEAPVGYVLDDTVRSATVSLAPAGGSAIHDLPNVVTNLKYNENGKSLLPSLPVTGALGFVLLVLAGVMIIALAVGTGFVAVGRNKKRAE